MRLKEIKPGRVYAIKAIDNTIVPGLVLDGILWYRLLDPETDTHYYAPAEDQKWATTSSFGSFREQWKNMEENLQLGQRSGILTVAPAMGTTITKKLLAQLNRLARTLDGSLERTVEAAAAFQQGISEPLRMDVVRTDYVRSTWEQHLAGPFTRKCPACGQDVEMTAASKLRSHPGMNGARCPRSGTQLTESERNS
ncbi:hypothetical protein ACWGQT_00660 [Streptomyces yangpuensis]